MNNIKTRNKLFTLLLLVIALLIPQWGWAQTASKPEKGDGSADNPYIIRTAENLAWFRNEVNKDFDHGNICAKIADDVEVIDMSTVCYKANASKKGLDWVPIGDGYTGFYQGTFDGNGKTITNLYIDTDPSCVGLFGFTYGATIKNLTLEYATVINDGDYTGILVGCAENESTLQNIKISKTCQIEMYSYNMTEGVINYTGGIAGKLVGNAYNCLNYANIQGKNLHEIRDVGGLFGEYNGNSMTACANYGKVTVAGSYVGGLVGSFLSGTIQDCANYGDVEGTYNVGGMAGYVYDGGKIQNVFCYGSISGTEGPSLEGIVFGNTPNKWPGTEGMVAYYSGAKLTIRGNEQKVKAFGGDNFSEEKATGYTEAQLKSGEVAWRLNGSTSVPAEGKTLAWYQKLGENGDAYPLLKSTGDNIVYHGLACNKATDVYTNNKSIFDISGIIPHKYEKNYDANGLYGDICTVCGEGSSTMYIKNFCGEEGKDLKLEVGSDGKYSTNDMELADGKAYNSPVDFLVRGSLTYTRNFKSNKWQTLYVPFCFDTSKLPEEYEVATINNFHEYELEDETKKVELEVKRVTDGSTIPALTPCIIRLKQMPTEGKQLNIEFNDIKAVAAANKSIDCWSISRYYKFNGTIEAKTTFDIESDFVMKDGELWKVSSRTKLNPQRWYLTAKDRSASQLAASAKLSRIAIKVVGNGQATGIEDIHVVSDEAAQSKQGIYDLQGRKLNQEPTHGIYIKNGKKYVK